MSNEPKIIVNGCELTTAQAMAVRVAISHLQYEVRNPATKAMLGDELANGYRDRLDEVASIIVMGG